MYRLFIVGDGGHGKVVLDCAIRLKRYSQISFIVNHNRKENRIRGFDYLNENEINIREMLRKHDEIIVALGNNPLRLEKSLHYENQGFQLATLIHPTAVISRFAQIGKGSVVLANATVNAFASIGKACIINTGAIVEHDCILGDGVHLSPNSGMGGNTIINNASWLCVGASLANNIIVGQNVVVAAGAAVVDDVADNVLVAGVPATIKKKILK